MHRARTRHGFRVFRVGKQALGSTHAERSFSSDERMLVSSAVLCIIWRGTADRDASRSRVPGQRVGVIVSRDLCTRVRAASERQSTCAHTCSSAASECCISSRSAPPRSRRAPAAGTRPPAAPARPPRARRADCEDRERGEVSAHDIRRPRGRGELRQRCTRASYALRSSPRGPGPPPPRRAPRHLLAGAVTVTGS